MRKGAGTRKPSKTGSYGREGYGESEAGGEPPRRIGQALWDGRGWRGGGVTAGAVQPSTRCGHEPSSYEASGS